jgi:hypothetical protein
VESQEQLVKRLMARSHLGGAGNLRLAQIHNQLDQAEASWEKRAEAFTTAIQALVGKR